MSFLKNNKGFTLIELLIVITIIGILAVAFLPSMLGAPSRARDTQRMADVKKIAAFVVSNKPTGTPYPANCRQFVNAYAVTVAGVQVFDDLAKDINANLNSFGGKFPQDPLSTRCFHNGIDPCGALWQKGAYWLVQYTNPANPYKFGVFARLENTEAGNIRNYNVESSPTSRVWDGNFTCSVDTNVTLVDGGGQYYGVLIQK